MNDIKRVFATAIEGEPPIRIDRAQLIRNGRRRLLGRRLAKAGGAALTVVAIAGSTTLFAGAGQPEQIQPATTGTTSSPSLSSVDVEHQLTKALADSRIVPSGLVLRATLGTAGALEFQRERDKYNASADLVDAQGNEGALYVEVASSKSNDSTPTCAAPNTCVQREFGGRQVQLTTAPFGPMGEVLLMAHTRLPDGVQVYALTSNVSSKAELEQGKAESAPTTSHHLVTLDQLGEIVGLAGLRLS